MDHNFAELRKPILKRLGFAATYGLTLDEFFKFAQDLYVELEAGTADAINGDASPAQDTPQSKDAEVGPTESEAQEDVAEPQGAPPQNALSKLDDSINHVQQSEAQNDAEIQAPSTDPSPRAVAARALCETQEWKCQLWDSLRAHPHFVVGPEGEGNGLSLAEIEALPLPPPDEIVIESEDEEDEEGGIPTRSRAKQKEAWARQRNSQTIPAAENEENDNPVSYQPRIFASHDKIWRTIAGHPKDWERLPASEFEALCAISAAGKEGIDQPTLVRLTGQDKKSTPKRTYALEKKGYIEKRPIVAPKFNTSCLTHKKFVDEEIARGTHYSLKITEPITTNDLSLVPGYEFWTGDVIYEDAFIRRSLDLFEAWGAIVYNDARTKMGVGDSKWHSKAFSKRVRTLCGIGLIEKGDFAMPGSERIIKGVIRFLRQPTNDEWRTLLRRTTREDAIGPELPPKPPKKPRKRSRKKGKKKETESNALPNDLEANNQAEPQSDDDHQETGPQEDQQPKDSSELPDATMDEPGNDEQDEPPDNPPDVSAPEDTVMMTVSSLGEAQGDGAVDEGRGPDQVSLPPEQTSQPIPIPLTPIVPKKRGRPAGRKDTAPRVKKRRLNENGDIARPETEHRESTDQAEAPAMAEAVEEAPPVRKPRVAKFTSYQELQRQEGVPGIYINPSGSLYGKKRKGIMVAVIKTNLLKTWTPRPPNPDVAEDASTPSHAQQTQMLPSADIGNNSLDTNAQHSPMAPQDISETPGQLDASQLLTNSHEIDVPDRLENEIIVFIDNSAYPDLASSIPNATATSPAAEASTSGPSSTDVSTLDSQTLQKLLETAATVEIPEEVGFIFALWNGVPGKLCLAIDKQFVIFHAKEPLSSGDSAIKIETAHISMFPTVTASNFMSGQFLVTTKENTYPFTIAIEEEAFSAANTLRAKIVTALMEQGIKEIKEKKPRFRPTPGGGEKIYQCEKCLQRWKNDNGLEYHLTKSRTTCNPNWDPSAPVPPRRVPQKRQSQPAVGVDEPLGTRRSKTLATTRSREQSLVLHDPDDEQSTPDELDEVLDQDLKRKAREGSVEDGDFIPDEVQRSPKKRKLNNSQAQGSKLDADDDLDMGSSEVDFAAPKAKNSATPRRKKPKGPKGPPPPTSRQSLKSIIYDLIEANGGVFPGDQNTTLWLVVCGEFRKKYPADDFPEKPKVFAALKGLADNKRVKKLTSKFKSNNGLMETVVLIATSSFDADCEEVQNLKTQIKSAHPDIYIPEAFKPSDSLIAELREIDKGAESRKKQVGILNNSYYLNKAAGEQDDAFYEPYLSEDDYEWVVESPDHVPDASEVSEKQRRAYSRKPQLPEVITFMQSPGDSTWSTHPFGHGARPIYARPGRRVEGNPATDARLRRLEHGHRPIIPPRKKMIGPARGSKILTGEDGKPRATRRPRAVHKLWVPRKRPDNMKVPVIIPPRLENTGRTITFLPPNTSLDDELSEENIFEQAKDLDFSQTQFLPISDDIKFTEMKTLHKIQGQYHIVSEETFEESSSSYTLEEPVMSQSFFVNQLVPKNLQEILQAPEAQQDRPKGGMGRISNYALFVEQIDSVKRWELANESLLGQGVVSPDINNAIHHTVKHVRNPQKSFTTYAYLDKGEDLTLSNPPWDSESFYESEEDRLTPVSVAVGRGRQPGNSKKPYSKINQFKTRKLTHFITDFEKNDDRTDVPITDFVPATAGKKGKKFAMSPEDENRFIIAHIAVSTIAGGLGKILDAILVSQLFPKFSLAKRRTIWCKIKKTRGKEIKIIENRFQEAFLTAYEDGDLPTLNYDDLLNYDWWFVINWYIEKNPVVSGSPPPELPPTSTELLEKYDIEDMQATDNWRDNFLGKVNHLSRPARLREATKNPLSISLHPERSSSTLLDEAALAKSVVRAAIATPGETYNLDVATTKLEKVGDEAVTKARDELVKQNAIRHKYRGRAVPRQPYMITEVFNKPFLRESMKSFPEALEFKKKLDEKFRLGETVKVARDDNDGVFMCITNLLAHDRIQLRQHGTPISEYGLLTHSYETNAIDKAKLLFTLEVEKTDSYVYNEDLISSFTSTGSDNLSAPGPLGDAIPAWRDINGDLLPDFWEKAKKGVLGALAMRAGADVSELGRILKGTLMGWEIGMMLEWGVGVGAVERIEGGIDGWIAGEWWWLIPSL